jgi:hypothetical protein
MPPSRTRCLKIYLLRRLLRGGCRHDARLAAFIDSREARGASTIKTYLVKKRRRRGGNPVSRARA